MPKTCCDECGIRLYRAGERAPAGTYLRVDDQSFQRLQLVSSGILPASFDGHIALYRVAAAPCACERRKRVAEGKEQDSAEASSVEIRSPAPIVIQPARGGHSEHRSATARAHTA